MVFSITQVLNGFSQKTALLSIDLVKPILYTDSLTIDQVSQNYFPIQVNCFDTIYSHLEYLKKLLSEDIQRAKFQSFELRAGATRIKVSSIKHAYGDSYDIELITKLNELTSSYKLGDNKKLNKGVKKKVEKLMIYMKNASSLFNNEFIEIQPRMYDVIIYKD